MQEKSSTPPFTGEVVSPPKTRKADRPKVPEAEVIDAIEGLVPADNSTGDNCREFPNAEALRAVYDRLDHAIRDDCAQFADHLVHAEIVLKTSLMPHLDRMQALLSQRGSRHNLELMKKLKLPSWQEYAAEVARQLRVDIRTLQRNLKYFREPKQRPPEGEPAKKVCLTPQQQRRLLEAAVLWNEAAEAVEVGGDYLTPIREYKKVALSSEEVGAMLDDPTAPDGVTFLAMELAQLVLKDNGCSDSTKRAARKLLRAAKITWRKADDPAKGKVQ